VVGLDVGGSATRCVVTDLDGEVLGRGAGPGANPNSSGGDPAGALGVALASALVGFEPMHVLGGVVGAAGAYRGMGRQAVAGAARAAWRTVGLTGNPTVATDLEIAYAAGTTEPDGLLLVSGTGAVAAKIEGGAVARRCDGYGWLLGDDGSAVWLGREAVRAVLSLLDGRGPNTLMLEPVVRKLGVPDPTGHSHTDVARAVVDAVHARPPASLGRLAPVVSNAAAAGDAVALAIASTAVSRLNSALDAIAEKATGLPIVLAGSVLLERGPISVGVSTHVTETYRVDPCLAEDPAAGAASMARARLDRRATTRLRAAPTPALGLASGSSPAGLGAPAPRRGNGPASTETGSGDGPEGGRRIGDPPAGGAGLRGRGGNGHTQWPSGGPGGGPHRLSS
jgi:glucosamine kinase